MDTVKICRLCLNRIYNNDFDLLENYMSQMENLFMNVNIGISVNPAICKECAAVLGDFLHFKSKCLGNLKDIKENGTLDLEELPLSESKDVYVNDILGVQNICRFCRKITEYEFTQLHDTKEYIFMVSMLQKHTPELNLNITEELTACKSCFDTLKNFHDFTTNYTDVEEKITNYASIKGIANNNHIQLSDVANFIYNDHLVKVEDIYGECGKGGSRNIKIKSEKLLEEDKLHMSIKTEEIHLKTELIDSDSKDNATMNHNIIYQKPSAVTMYECNLCSYKTKLNKCLKQHLSKHKDPSERKIFCCQLCTFTTHFKHSLVRHQDMHKSSKIIHTRMYKCDHCPHAARRKGDLNQHMLRHKSPTEVTMHKCTKCMFTTKHKKNISRHSIIHKDPAEVSLFKCDKCSHEAMSLSNLKRHMLNHKGLSEVTLLECGKCSYKTKRKYNLKNHITRVHRDPAEITLLKCDLCSYGATKLSCLNRHMITHKTLPELSLLESNKISHKARNKDNLIQHKKLHRGPAEVTILICHLCPYVGTKRSSLERHIINHKNLSEITLLECYNCFYKTRHRDNLVKHIRVHHKDFT